MILFLIFFLFFFIHVPQYGDVLGWTKEGVVVFSNEKSNKKSNENERSYAGEKWECVEFVRRFLINTRGITFDEIDHAYDIFNLPYFQTLDGMKTPIVIFRNDGKNKAQIGDILVLSKDVDDRRHGHVAIVVETKENGHVLIAEQNWENEDWGGHNYSRIIHVESEPYLMGWIKI